MRYLFDLKEKKAGYSRTGRIVIRPESKKYLYTPNIIIPMNSMLMRNFNFVNEFKDHKLFLIFKEKHLKKQFYEEKFHNVGFIFSHSGTLERFNEILEKKIKYIKESRIIPLIPFNNPTTCLSKDHAIEEIIHYLAKVKKILEKHEKIFFGLTIRIFDFPDLIEQYIEFIQEHKNIKGINLSDFFDDLRFSRNLLESYVKIKEELDNNLIIVASGKITPILYPMLIYLGVDLIDPSYLLYLSAEHFYEMIEKLVPIYKIKRLPCSCIACREKLAYLKKEKQSSEKIINLSLHNLFTARDYVDKINQYINFEDFRAFVESSSLNDMSILTMLRLIDSEYSELMRKRTPIALERSIINCMGEYSLNRPDFCTFRERAKNRFNPEPWTNVIILLPCSSKKPYSKSKSHQKFYSIIRNYHEFPNFQEIILTSPLGAIPRQLEDIYPVNSYEISVTGQWNREELEIAAIMLINLLEKYDKKIPIICHLDGGYREIAELAEKRLSHRFFYSQISKGTTSREALESLNQLLEEHKNDVEIDEDDMEETIFYKTLRRKFNKILDYQFGREVGNSLITRETRFKKNRFNSKVAIFTKKGGKKIGDFDPVSGQIELSLFGGQIIKDHENFNNNIIFDGKKFSGNTLFRPGIKEWNENLLPGSIVLVLNDDKSQVIGVGRMVVSSAFIEKSQTGKIVEVYEHV